MSKARVDSRSTFGGRGPRRRGTLRHGAWVVGLGLGLGAAQLSGAVARADDTLVIHVRGRSQLRLRESERAATGGGRFQLTVQVQLDDGHARADADPGDSATGAAEMAGEAKSPGVDPARSFAGQAVRLRLSGPDGELGRHTATTGPDGRAVVPFGELPTGSYTVVADYAGDDLRDPAHADLTVDLGRQSVLLALQAPAQAARRAELFLRVSLLSEERAFPAEVKLSVGDLRRSVRLIGGFGQLAVPLRALAGLRAGQSLAVIASFPGDRQHSSALQRRDVLLTSQARVTLELAAGALGHAAVAEIPQGSTVTAVGVVLDEEGPLPGEPVDLELSEQPGGERPTELSESGAAPPSAPETRTPAEPSRLRRVLASGLTDSNGRFRIVIQRLPLRPGPAVLAAQVTPRHSYILPARAAELPIVVLPPEPVSAIYYVLPLLASALGGLMWLLGRWLQPMLTRLGAALREARSLRARRSPEAAASPSLPVTAHELPLGEPGVSLSQGRRLAGLTLRRTIDTTLDGQVLDASFGRPVDGAAVTLQPVLGGTGLTPPGSDPKLARTVQASAEGRFAVSQLPAGRYLVEVTAPGYLPQRFPAAVPHRGELRGVSVRLEPMRVRLLGQWQRVAQRLLGQESRLRTATPRELLEQFGRLRAAAAVGYGATARDLQRLTDLVEQAYYSPRICTAEMLAEAARLADSVLASGATPGVQLPAAPQQAAGPPVPLS